MNLTCISCGLLLLLFAESDALNDPSKKTMYYTRIPSRLHALEDLEKTLYDAFNGFKQEIQSNLATTLEPSKNQTELLQLLDSYLQDYTDSTINLKLNYNSTWNNNGNYKIGWNMLATMRMIKRLYKLAPKLLDVSAYAFTSNFREAGETILAYMKSRNMIWPIKQDYQNVLNSILGIQYEYTLDTEDMIEGTIFGTPTPVKLRGSDCIDLGTYAFQNRMLHVALSWLYHGIKKLEVDNFFEEVQHAREVLKKAIKIHDKIWHKHQPNVLFMKIGDNLEDALRLHRAWLVVQDAKQQADSFRQNYCQSKSTRTGKAASTLFCWYETKQSPYLRIHPAKAELLATRPVIVRYHEIIGEKLIQFLISAADQKLTPAEAAEDVGGEEKPSEINISGFHGSATTEVNNSHVEIVALEKIIESVTGLTLDGDGDVEPFGMAAYVFGASYGLHTDDINLDLDASIALKGDRMATFLFYLSDVEKGGETQFIKPGILAEPIRGSAIFWYTLNAAGELDEATWHGGCSVILGEKWIANRWIRMNGQYKTQKCEKGRRLFKFHVNGRLIN